MLLVVPRRVRIVAVCGDYSYHQVLAVAECFVFFKQKTAYEMRISDWSSDVCSSDLLDGPGRICILRQPRHQAQPAVSPGHGPSWLHAMHQCQQKRVARDFRTIP